MVMEMVSPGNGRTGLRRRTALPISCEVPLSNVSDARHIAINMIRSESRCLPDRLVEDIETAVGEALANAIRHGKDLWAEVRLVERRYSLIVSVYARSHIVHEGAIRQKLRDAKKCARFTEEEAGRFDDECASLGQGLILISRMTRATTLKGGSLHMVFARPRRTN